MAFPSITACTIAAYTYIPVLTTRVFLPWDLKKGMLSSSDHPKGMCLWGILASHHGVTAVFLRDFPSSLYHGVESPALYYQWGCSKGIAKAGIFVHWTLRYAHGNWWY